MPIYSQRIGHLSVIETLSTERSYIDNYIQAEEITDGASILMTGDLLVPEDLYGILQRHIESMNSFDKPRVMTIQEESTPTCSSPSSSNNHVVYPIVYLVD